MAIILVFAAMCMGAEQFDRGCIAATPLPHQGGASQQTTPPEVHNMATQPIARFRAGQVSCAIWENEIPVDGTTKAVLKTSVSRRYKDRDGNWKSSQSLGCNEILLAIHCLRQAVARIIEEERVQSGSNGVKKDVVV